MPSIKLLHNNIKRFISITTFVMVVFLIVIFFSTKQATHNAFADQTTSQNSHLVKTTSYELADNTNYQINNNSKRTNPLDSNLLSVHVDVNTTTGTIEDMGTKTINGKQVNQYGFEVGYGDITDNAIVDIKLNFNKTFSTITSGDLYGQTRINSTPYKGDTGWYLSNDSAQSVAEFTNIGVINSGALVLSKSYDGINWTWQRDGYANEYKTNFHTT
ncbi:MAG: hypothetical protein LBF12_05690, partial [Christensenellaceae bacterium]|nr:hypothetical protein [Christensenellaceae bacterium]